MSYRFMWAYLLGPAAVLLLVTGLGLGLTSVPARPRPLPGQVLAYVALVVSLIGGFAVVSSQRRRTYRDSPSRIPGAYERGLRAGVTAGQISWMVSGAPIAIASVNHRPFLAVLASVVWILGVAPLVPTKRRVKRDATLAGERGLDLWPLLLESRRRTE